MRGEELTSRGMEILEPYKVRRAIFIAASIGERRFLRLCLTIPR